MLYVQWRQRLSNIGVVDLPLPFSPFPLPSSLLPSLPLHSPPYPSHRRRNRGGRGGLGPLTFLFEGPNVTVAPSLLKNAAPSLS